MDGLLRDVRHAARNLIRDARVRARHDPDAGARDRREHRDLLGGQRRDPAAARLSAARSAHLHLEPVPANGIRSVLDLAAGVPRVPGTDTCVLGRRRVRHRPGEPDRAGSSAPRELGAGVGGAVQGARRQRAVRPDVRSRRDAAERPAGRDPVLRALEVGVRRQRRASSDSQVEVNGVRRTVVGIMPPQFRRRRPARRGLDCRSSSTRRTGRIAAATILYLIGRLADGVDAGERRRRSSTRCSKAGRVDRACGRTRPAVRTRRTRRTIACGSIRCRRRSSAARGRRCSCCRARSCSCC